jgi:hypothetical protein
LSDDGVCWVSGGRAAGEERRSGEGDGCGDDGVEGDDEEVVGDVVGAEVDDASEGCDAGAVGERGADRAPEAGEEGCRVGATGAGVAEDDEEDQGETDADRPEQDLEGDRDGRGAVDDERSERGNR